MMTESLVVIHNTSHTKEIGATELPGPLPHCLGRRAGPKGVPKREEGREEVLAPFWGLYPPDFIEK